MSCPIFLHIMANGDMYFCNNRDQVPTGTIAGTYHINSDASFQKIGTLSGVINSSLVAGSSHVGLYGKQLT